MMKPLTLTAILALLAAPALADHGNPWAQEGDTVLSRNHDANQVKSIDTPGEAEMRGVMVRKARGKLENTGQSGASASRQAGRN